MPLVMSFDPNTIDHLGIKMYSHLPNALAELIANAYDADATQVAINLYDHEGIKRIEVLDNGTGMNFEEINSKFLRIGRPRRNEEDEETSSGRKVTGKKGLGKLALFGLANQIQVSTTSKGTATKTEFILNWEQLKATPAGESYEPVFKEPPTAEDTHGTTIVLEQLNRSSQFNVQGLAVSLSKLFDLFDDEFQCTIRLNDEEPIIVNSELRYTSLDDEFYWDLPDFTIAAGIEYENLREVTGKILSTEKPLQPGLRGISLFARGRLVNAAEFYGRPESSHVFSYLTGWLNVDFIDDLDQDVISTNRQALNWDHPVTEKLRGFLDTLLQAITRDWRIKRKEKKTERMTRGLDFDVDTWRETVPDRIRDNVVGILNMLTDAEGGASNEKGTQILGHIHDIAPDYADLHWRELHSAIQTASEDSYKDGHYYTAVFEAAKCYIDAVREKSQVETNVHDYHMMGVFTHPIRRQQPPGSEFLSVTDAVENDAAFTFPEQTYKNIQNGQSDLSKGIVTGYRNPLAHRVNAHLKNSGLITEKDCLDALSIISHLFRRLDDAVLFDTTQDNGA